MPLQHLAQRADAQRVVVQRVVPTDLRDVGDRPVQELAAELAVVDQQAVVVLAQAVGPEQPGVGGRAVDAHDPHREGRSAGRDRAHLQLVAQQHGMVAQRVLGDDRLQHTVVTGGVRAAVHDLHLLEHAVERLDRQEQPRSVALVVLDQEGERELRGVRQNRQAERWDRLTADRGIQLAEALAALFGRSCPKQVDHRAGASRMAAALALPGFQLLHQQALQDRVGVDRDRGEQARGHDRAAEQGQGEPAGGQRLADQQRERGRPTSGSRPRPRSGRS